MKDSKKPIIAVVGLAGSGKTEVTKRFIERGFLRVGFNDVYNSEFEKRGISKGDELGERRVREELRKEFGMDFAAKQGLPKIEEALREGKAVVVESLYSWEEYTFLKEKFLEGFRVLAVWAPPDLRYERLAMRPDRPFTREDAQSRDYAQIANIHQAGPIAMAEWMILNTGTMDELLVKVDEVIGEILG